MTSSQKVIEGIRFIKKDKYAVCLIDSFSTELKELISEHLSSICYGASKASSKRKSYNYENTLKEFLKRYEDKPDHTRIGMIGELITHVLILELLTKFKTVSPYFNMEERSNKKGFDVVLTADYDRELWITEVKSGKKNDINKTNSNNSQLLGRAKRDLKKRLNQAEASLWENAINGADAVLDNYKDSKEAVRDILGDISDKTYEGYAISNDKNVLLVSALFSSLNDEISEESLKDYYHKTVNEMIFNDVMIFSIQKEMYEKVYKFLKKEARK